MPAEQRPLTSGALGKKARIGVIGASLQTPIMLRGLPNKLYVCVRNQIEFFELVSAAPLLDQLTLHPFSLAWATFDRLDVVLSKSSQLTHSKSKYKCFRTDSMARRRRRLLVAAVCLPRSLPESRMRQTRTSGLMSGEGKRSHWPSASTPPHPSSTLQSP